MQSQPGVLCADLHGVLGVVFHSLNNVAICVSPFGKSGSGAAGVGAWGVGTAERASRLAGAGSDKAVTGGLTCACPSPESLGGPGLRLIAGA